MLAEELTDKICAWARSYLVSKAGSDMTRGLIGAMTVGIGKRNLAAKVNGLAKTLGAANGDIDVSSLKESVMGYFEYAKGFSALGGVITLDKGDAEAFFSSIGA